MPIPIGEINRGYVAFAYGKCVCAVAEITSNDLHTNGNHIAPLLGVDN